MADQFAPTASQLSGQKLMLNIGCGTAVFGSVISQIPASTFPLPANATSYVYFDCMAKMLGSNTTGFGGTTVYPIAVAVTNGQQVVTLTDVRGAIFVYGAH